jgi:hypothetical protein
MTYNIAYFQGRPPKNRDEFIQLAISKSTMRFALSFLQQCFKTQTIDVTFKHPLFGDLSTLAQEIDQKWPKMLAIDIGVNPISHHLTKLISHNIADNAKSDLTPQ